MGCTGSKLAEQVAAVHKAVLWKNADEVGTLLEQVELVKNKDFVWNFIHPDHKNSLLIACVQTHKQNIAVLDALLKAGDLNKTGISYLAVKDSGGNTCLDYAVSLGKLYIIEWWVQNNLPVNKQTMPKTDLYRLKDYLPMMALPDSVKTDEEIEAYLEKIKSTLLSAENKV